MDLPTNRNEPTVMWIDMNSCFATVEQQANPLIRNKPVAVAAYTTGSGCIVSPSYEAKRMGVKVGMTVREGKMLCKGLIVLPPDPPKYRAAHMRLKKIFQDYSPDVLPKSIDEVAMEFAGTPALKRGLVNIGMEIKQRVHQELGEWVTVNIGIATNRFLAKTAAGLHKPDGLDVITWENLEEVYKGMELTDLCGINKRYEARLNAAGIFTATEFYTASREVLMRQVFMSINGHYWYLRLRGWEPDAVVFDRKSFGNSYSLPKHTSEPKQLSRLLMKLCEKSARRMRGDGSCAYGVHVACLYSDGTHWHRGKRFDQSLYTTNEIYVKAMYVLNRQPMWKPVRNLAVSCYDLAPYIKDQLALFETDIEKRRRLSDALDSINDKYGEFIVTPALMLGMENEILDRISFGGVKELVEEAYQQ